MSLVLLARTRAATAYLSRACAAVSESASHVDLH